MSCFQAASAWRLETAGDAGAVAGVATLRMAIGGVLMEIIVADPRRMRTPFLARNSEDGRPGS
jgi:hypothetical protein